MDELKRDLKLDVVLHAKSLEDEGVDVDAPIDVDLKGSTVRTALKVALDPHGLTYSSDGPVLYVLTKVAAEERLTARVYDVSDLVLRDLDNPDAGADYDSLRDVITSSLAPQSWDEVGGRGSIQPFEAAGINTLVVSQSDHVHEEIEILLAGLRKVRRAAVRKKPPPRETPDVSIEDVAGPRPPSGPLPSNPDRDALLAPQTRLACELYAQVAAQQKGGNFIFSPYSLAHALSMAAAGAKGETATEFAKVLHGDLPPVRLHPAMAAQAQELPLGEFLGQQLRLANRLWAQKGQAPLVDDFLRTTRTHYGAEVAVANLADDATCKAINAWTEEQTKGKIRDLFAPGSFDASTKLVLVNALYFQGLWQTPFSDVMTKPRAFQTPAKAIQTPTMHLEDFDAQYAKLEGLELLTKRYRSNLAMTVLLPKAGTDLAEFERSLTAENLQTWLAAPARPHVEIFLPTFRHETALDLKAMLSAMGLQRAFTPGQADFTGICTEGDLYLDQWKHRATIEVDEKGTVAAAATGGGFFGFGGSVEKPRIPLFRADRPFLFLIRDLRTKTILFLGRVTNPAADQ